MIADNLAKKYKILPLEECINVFGNSDSTKMMFYQTFLEKTDFRSTQRQREILLGIEKSLSDEEYIALQQYRQYAVEQIRLLK